MLVGCSKSRGVGAVLQWPLVENSACVGRPLQQQGRREEGEMSPSQSF